MKTLSILCFAFLMVSCYSYKPMKSTDKTVIIPIEESISRVETGKGYRFELADGRRIRLEVASIESESISGMTNDYYNGQNQRVYLEKPMNFSIPKKEIQSIRWKKFSAGKTVIVVLIPIGLLAAYISSQPPQSYGLSFSK